MKLTAVEELLYQQFLAFEGEFCTSTTSKLLSRVSFYFFLISSFVIKRSEAVEL